MKTLSLNPSRAKWRPAAVAVKKLDVPVIRANGEVVRKYEHLTPPERKAYRRAKLRRDAEKEMKTFQKILTTEADLAQAREELKVATGNLRHKEMNHIIKHIHALERKLAKLRGVKPPKEARRKRRTGRVIQVRPDGSHYILHQDQEGNRYHVGRRSRQQIAEDKLLDMQNGVYHDCMERGAYIATLEGYTEGTHAHFIRTCEHVDSISMIERLQAFEDTQSRYAHHAEDQLRYEHFCDNR